MSETKPGETTGSSHVASLEKDLATLDKIVKALEKSHKDDEAVQTLSRRLANIGRAVGGVKAGQTPIDDYRKVRVVVTAALDQFSKEAKKITKPPEPEDEDDGVIEFSATTDGAKELHNDKNAKMIQAVKNALDDTGGRAGPKIDGIAKPFWHIHVGGNAKNNLLYRKGVILGLIDFHIDKSNNQQEKDAVKKVANRTGSVDMKIEDGVISRA